MVSFQETAFFLWSNRCVYTGYPVREEFLKEWDRGEARRQLGLPADRFVVLVYGGSLGSRSINRLMAATLPRLAELGGPGAGDPLDRARAARSTRPGTTPLRVLLRRLPGGRHDRGRASARTELSLAGGRVIYRLRPVPPRHRDVHGRRRPRGVPRRRRHDRRDHRDGQAGHRGAQARPARRPPGAQRDRAGRAAAAARSSSSAAGPTASTSSTADELWRSCRACVAEPERLAAPGATARDAASGAPTRRFSGHRSDVLLAARGRGLHARHRGAEDGADPDAGRPPRRAAARASPRTASYRSLYGIKMEEALASPDWQVVNRGIKLAGALRPRPTSSPSWCAASRPATASCAATCSPPCGTWARGAPRCCELVDQALADGYFEVRAAAFALAAAFAEPCVRDQPVDRGAPGRRHGAPLRALRGARPGAALPAVAAPVRGVPAARLALPFRRQRPPAPGDPRRRQGGPRRRLPRRPRARAARRFISDMLITTSDFAPQFRIRESFRALATQLEARVEEGVTAWSSC